MLTIQPNAHVILDYTLRDEGGEVLDDSTGEGGEPIAYVHGYGMIVPGLETALVGLSAGDEREILVPPEAGYGERDDELVMAVDRSDFPDPGALAEGDEFLAQSPDGDEVLVRVLELRDEAVVVDANHPLAGKTLRYEVKVRDVRPATRAEIESAASAVEELEEERRDTSQHDSELVTLGRKPRDLN